MQIDFIKCHGSGNDFPLIDARAVALSDAQWGVVARLLSDRAGPVGSDGLLLLTNGGPAQAFGMRMFNADGSEAETCLNGLRCVARAGFAAFGVTQATVQLKTSTAEVARDADLAPGVYTVRETAGPADLDVSRWPLMGAMRLVEALVPGLPSPRLFTAVAMPNPHLISFVDRIDDAELSAIGAVCEAAPDWLPNRANVSFVELRGHDLFVRTFERGVGLTDSCGSAMAAATVAGCLTGRIGYDAPLTVFNRGGMVRASVSPELMVTLSGNASFEWRGLISIDLASGQHGALTVIERYDDEVAAWDAVLAGISDG
ncbi:MAG: diaminopimelate epimerase [Proteobacteria bacterium ST_bin14]|nr:MAG: diaminopimelate epimerase [Proteobacteria bacterium ST_bin14]